MTNSIQSTAQCCAPLVELRPELVGLAPGEQGVQRLVEGLVDGAPVGPVRPVAQQPLQQRQRQARGHGQVAAEGGSQGAAHRLVQPAQPTGGGGRGWVQYKRMHEVDAVYD